MLKQSNYTKNILTLLTGNAFAQAIPIAISPLLTRLYTPTDFGVAGLFATLIALLSSMVNAKYESAILVSKNDEDAYSIAYLALFISIIFSIFCMLIIIIFHDFIIDLLGNKEISIWLYFIPFVIFLTGLYNVLNYLNTKEKNFKQLSIVQVYKSISTAAVQLTLSQISNGGTGLIIGQITSNFIGNYTLIKKTKLFNFKIDIKNIKTVAKKYIKFPLYYLPNNIIFYLNPTILTVFITSVFGIGTLGLYNMANRILGIPGTVIALSISQVYAQRASELANNNESISSLYLTTLGKLIIISLPLFLIAFFTLEDLFAFIFGKEWSIAGYYGEILTPYFFFRFIATGLNPTTLALQKQNIELYKNILMLLSIFILLLITYYYELSIDCFLNVFTMLLSSLIILNLILYFIIIKMVDNEKN